MNWYLTLFILFFTITCSIIPKNPTDPNNPDYIKPYLVFDSTNVKNGDTVTLDYISLNISGNIPDKNQYRYRTDSLTWDAWKSTRNEGKIEITFTEADTGNHTLAIQTCYNPNGDITDTTVVFVKVDVPRISAMSDTAVQIASDQPLKMWVTITGTKPFICQWFCNGLPKSMTTKDSLIFDSVKMTDQGKYFCVVSNHWGADTSDTIRLTVSKTNYAPKWKADTLHFVLPEGQTLIRNLADSCADRNGDLLIFRKLFSTFTRDSLSPEGVYSLTAGPDDSGSYRAVAVVSDSVLADTVILHTVVHNVNRPPTIILLEPADSAQAIPKTTVFKWRVFDADGDGLISTVRIGSATQLNTVLQSSDSTGSFPTVLQAGQQYFWQVSVADGVTQTTKPLRKFVVNNPPCVTIITPGNTTTAVSIPPLLVWQPSDPDSVDKGNLTSCVYIWKNSAIPAQIYCGGNSSSLQAQNIEYASTYNWYVATNDTKDTTKSQTQTFTTLTPSCALDSIIFPGGFSLNPTFQSNVISYSAYLSYRTDSLQVRIIKAESFTTINIGADTLRSASYTFKNIPYGLSSRGINVFVAGTGYKKAYTIGFTRNTYQPIFVNCHSQGKNNGTSWTDAYTNLQTAIDGADSGAAIWVAQGTYYPTWQSDTSDQRTKSFSLKNGISFYGGLQSGSASLLNRDSTTNMTFLSADIGVKNNSTDNAYHILYINSGTATHLSTVTLNGFTLTDGYSDSYTNRLGCAAYFNNANVNMQNITIKSCVINTLINACIWGDSSNLYLQNCLFGGNVYAYGGSGDGGGVVFFNKCKTEMVNCKFQDNKYTPMVAQYCDRCMLTNCIFTGNNSKATTAGGLRGYATNLNLNGCLFSRDSTNQNGGALAVVGPCSLTVNACEFDSNYCDNGGAIAAAGAACIINGCTFINNSNRTSVSGINWGYASALTANDLNLTIINSTFVGNLGGNGGAIYANGYNGNSNRGHGVLIVNSTFSGNVAIDSGASIYCVGLNSANIINSIFWGDTAWGNGLKNNFVFDSGTSNNVSFSIYSTANPSWSTNIKDNPLLMPLTNNGGFVKTMALSPGSPAIDNGTTALPAGVTISTDVRGVLRPQRNGIDIGAFELE